VKGTVVIVVAFGRVRRVGLLKGNGSESPGIVHLKCNNRTAGAKQSFPTMKYSKITILSVCMEFTLHVEPQAGRLAAAKKCLREHGGTLQTAGPLN